MTVAIFVSPEVVPALASDIIITKIREGGTDKSFSIKPGDRLRGIRKTSVNHEDYSRKTYILDEKTAVSFAGERDTGLKIIREFIRNRWRNPVRPMRLLGDIANSFTDPITKGPVCFLGAEVIPQPGGGYFVNQVSPYGETTLPNLGKSAVTGSGGTELLSVLKHTDKKFDLSQPSIPYRSAFHKGKERIIGAFSYVTSLMIFGDLYLDGEISISDEFEGNGASYGGFLDFCYYDPHQGNWTRQPDALHCFFEIEVSKTGQSSERMAPYAVAYRSEKERSGLLCVAAGENQMVVAQTLSDPTASSYQTKYKVSDWAGWQPEALTVHLFTRQAGRALTLGVKTYPGKFATVKAGADWAEVRINPGLLKMSVAEMKEAEIARQTG